MQEYKFKRTKQKMNIKSMKSLKNVDLRVNTPYEHVVNDDDYLMIE